MTAPEQLDQSQSLQHYHTLLLTCHFCP